MKLPDSGRMITKQAIRASLAGEWSDDKRLQQESESAWYFLSSPGTIKTLEGVFAKLQSKSKL